MRSVPPEVIATWPKPNYVDPVTRGPSLMIIELTLLPIAMIVVFLRLWVRISWLKKSWYDDYLMILAMVFSIGTHKKLGSKLAHSDMQCRHHRDCDNGIPAVWLGSPCMGPKAPRDDGGQTGTTAYNPCHHRLMLMFFRRLWLVRHYSCSHLQL
jgi:hypothetical protein